MGRFALIFIAANAVFLSGSGTNIANAQTAIEFKTSEPNLEKEYREELDKWMLRAYEGDRDAQFKVGVLFTNEQFDRADYEQAVYWYKQAARQGHVMAQYNLGHQYLTGVGVEKNERIAMQWWLEAAKLDHALAQFNIGRAYYLGIGVNEDHAQSKYWFERAAQNQEPKSIEILQQLGWYDAEQMEQQTLAQNSEDNAARQAVQDSVTTPDPLESRITPVDKAPEANIDEAGNTAGNESSDAVAGESAATEAAQQKSAVALYTNPAVRNVLITIVDDRASLTVSKAGDEWTVVQSKIGFPVWVHGDFIEVANDRGTISGQAVNARSVPIVTSGTVVGRFNKDEQVTVLDKRKEWYRVTAPKRFKAWVKTQDFERSAEVLTASSTTAPAQPQPAQQAEAAPGSRDATIIARGSASKSIDDNAWLFNQPEDSYTLQLASFDDPVKVAEFISRHKFADNPELHRFTARNKDIEWTYFLYGSYSQKEAAETAKNEIKQKLAWLRTFGRLQQNRCVAWKTQFPTPEELNKYCTL